MRSTDVNFNERQYQATDFDDAVNVKVVTYRVEPKGWNFVTIEFGPVLMVDTDQEIRNIVESTVKVRERWWQLWRFKILKIIIKPIAEPLD